MKRVVDALYGLKGYPNSARFTEFKTDFFANGSTPAVVMNTAVATGFTISAATTTGILLSSTATNGISITGVCSTSGLSISSASAKGIALSGAFTSAAISVTATASRGLSIGTKGTVADKSVDGSLAIAATLAFDTEPANNYLLGVFAKVSSTAVSATDDLGAAWLRTRLNAAMATNAGYSLYGAKTQLRIYGGTTTTVSNWAAAGCLGVLEVSGASTTFASGAIAAAVYGNVSLTSDATIASGAVVAGLVSISASASITDTGAAYFGVYVGKSGAVAFDAGLKVASSSCTTGVDIGTCTTGVTIGTATSGIALTGTITQGLNITAATNMTYLMKFNTVAGCVRAVDVDPNEPPSGGGLGADAVITILINATPYYIPIFTTLNT